MYSIQHPQIDQSHYNIPWFLLSPIDDIILRKDLVNNSNVQLLYEPNDIVLDD
jgi:hypothetical protein